MDSYNDEYSAIKIAAILTAQLKCPITHGLMVDPVIAEDGHTYERTAIEKWLKRNTNSPLNPSKSIKSNSLVTIRTIQKFIQTLMESGVVDEKFVAAKKSSKNGKEDSTVKISTDDMTELFICPITHGLMVDPVTAEDGHTYERSAIENWLQRKTSSPLDPSKTIQAQDLIVARIVQHTIQTLIESGTVDRKLSDDWKEKRREMDLEKAHKIFEEGCILDAAKLGLPRAQGEVAGWYLKGSHGMAINYDKCFDWASKAVDGNDSLGQHYLGSLFKKGLGREKDLSMAILCYENVAKQGFTASMWNLGMLYENEGCKLDHEFLRKAAKWYKKAADAGHVNAMMKIGKFYYYGKGVTKNLKTARDWFEKVSKEDVCQFKAEFWLGKMMMKGEGGFEDRVKGFTLINSSASKGYPYAQEWIEKVLKI